MAPNCPLLRRRSSADHNPVLPEGSQWAVALERITSSATTAMASSAMVDPPSGTLMEASTRFICFPYGSVVNKFPSCWKPGRLSKRHAKAFFHTILTIVTPQKSLQNKALGNANELTDAFTTWHGPRNLYLFPTVCCLKLRSYTLNPVIRNQQFWAGNGRNSDQLEDESPRRLSGTR
jgi:hypothetical protein